MDTASPMRLLKLALLVCDHLIPAIKDKHGDYPALLGNLFGEAGRSLGIEVLCVPYSVIDGEYPPRPQEYDAIVLSGSKYSAYEKLAWIETLKAFVKAVDAENTTKIIGICFGHQIIAEALGGQVGKNPLGWEVGFTAVQLTEQGRAAPLWQHKGTTVLDHVTQMPSNFQVLGTTELSHIQVMAKGATCFSVQAHPEFSSAIVQDLIGLRSASGVFQRCDAEKWLSVVENPTDGVLVAAAILSFTMHTPWSSQSALSGNKPRTVNSFVAHSTKTNCLRIGPKSGRVIVTGGEDRKVNLWAIGRPSAVLSLTGHSSPVECVCLDWPEELVVAGSSSGALKLWDLEHAKVIRTLSGHKSSATCVQFHPFGEFFASGSSDSTVRLWDVRRKGCIQTYHGHKDTVGQLEITPDGRWIASSGADCTVKIWDMTAGKLLHTISTYPEPIASLSFSPSEFILATASLDGCLRIYDLQTFDCMSTSSRLINGSSKTSFSSDGKILAASSAGSFDLWKWDQLTQPPTSLVPGWSNIVDFKFLPDMGGVLACGLEQNLVEVWMLDISMMTDTKDDEKLNTPNNESMGGHLEYRTEDITPYLLLKAKPFFMRIYKSAVTNTGSSSEIGAVEIPMSNRTSLSTEPNAPDSHCTEQLHLDSHQEPPQKSTKKEYTSSQSLITPTQHTAHKELDRQSPSTLQKNTSSYIPACDGNRPLNLDLARFITQIPGITKQPAPLSRQERLTNSSSESDVMEAMLSWHTSMEIILHARRDNLRLSREVWTESNPKATIDVSTDAPSLCELLFEMYEDYIQIACATVQLLLQNFGDIVVNTIHASRALTQTMDIPFEERLNRCKACFNGFVDFANILGEMQKYHGKLGDHIREISAELKSFCSNAIDNK
ncbi:hypothetical protein BSLG_006932 [Batrachochytrium salamandrivorans]|nr:hypothetical protein BSLG_006932 [Batrachochytrium salamandrivorans]